MLGGETADQDPSLDAAELEWAALWESLPHLAAQQSVPPSLGH